MNDIRQTQPTILYVDDEELAGKYFARAVDADYEVLLARSSDEAIAVLQQDSARIAVLVTDFRMPGRDGGDLLRQVAQEYPHIVRILVTAYADVDVLLQTVNTGEVFRILEKPLRPVSVRETLQMAIERYRERAIQNQRLMAIDETLAFLAHELNTPLAAIALNASSIENRGDVEHDSPQEIIGAARSMRESAQYCIAVVSSFWRSVHNGHRKLAEGDARSEITAHGLISALLDTYPFAAAQRSWVQVEINGDFPVVTQPNCVALVLSSLLSNALRAVADVPSPSVRFTVTADPGPRIRICDNGPGIPPEIKARLLTDPITTHAKSGGNGLGLILCDRVMQSCGGGLQIESTSGVGTTVLLDFPPIKGQTHRSY
ncbi:hybrid sensor histidine kinase/response regulator [Paraburkholderia aromaticivorans]|uniref:histidine kinase n=1 Tax=Paraburkholderia aromaticivorans TaxID=2026199 RepID=A0A248VTX0_9BURK|nr:hybrid sensor histidine kinase/response regulator [Paraburkholderia aromaticivorans]ASW02474.1 hybrid sensor histidine kinase/response regulator [Paraburkholderia aromaticivorans]